MRLLQYLNEVYMCIGKGDWNSHFTIYKNPTKKDINEMLRQREDLEIQMYGNSMSVRMLINLKTKTLYVFSGWHTQHYDAIELLKKEGERDKLAEAGGEIRNNKLYGYRISPRDIPPEEDLSWLQPYFANKVKLNKSGYFI